MTVKLDLVVEGFDILSDALDDAPLLATAQWRVVGGLTLAAIFSDYDAVSAACTFSHKVENSGLGKVVRVHEDFVTISEIAARLEVSRETIRSWVNGHRGPGSFPDHHHLHESAGKGPMKVWEWADVNAWLRPLAMDDGFEYLSAAERAEVNAHLLRIPETAGSEWQNAMRVQDLRLLGIAFGSLEFRDTAIYFAKHIQELPGAKDSHYRPLASGSSRSMKTYK